MPRRISRARLVWHEYLVVGSVRLSEHEARARCLRGGAVAVLADSWPTPDGRRALSVVLAGRPGPALRALCADLEKWFGAAHVTRGREACARLS